MLKNNKQWAFSLLAGTAYILSLSGTTRVQASIVSSVPLSPHDSTATQHARTISQTIPGTNIRRCHPPQWSQLRTALYYCSQPGDYIGGGQEHTYTPVDGDFIVSGNSSGGVVSIYFNGGPVWWTADFIAPRGAQLTKGLYQGAQRYPFQSPTKPGFSFSGSGRGCNELSAQFRVLQIVYDNDGKIKLFDATFVQSCETVMPPLYGRIKYNRADAPPS